MRGRVEPDDLVQEVFLRALSHPDGLPPPEPGEAALWRILARLARNVVIDVARSIRAAKRDGRNQPLSRSDWSAVPAARTAGPATAAGEREASRELATRFLELSPEHRRVIGLRQFEGLSARETAARMGRSEAAVHSLYRRALEAWEDMLDRRPRARGQPAGGPRRDGP